LTQPGFFLSRALAPYPALDSPASDFFVGFGRAERSMLPLVTFVAELLLSWRPR